MKVSEISARKPFRVVSHAKWTLTGEHSVIRGGKAIAFPLKEYKNVTTFQAGKTIKVIDNKVSDSEEVITSLVDVASAYTKIPAERFFGIFKIESSIPIGSGLGSSAALCANIAKLAQFLGYDGDLMELARHLENKFHKNSSGLDVAVVLLSKPIVFQNNKVQKILNVGSLPGLGLTYSGKRSLTSACVEKINKLFEMHPQQARILDERMNTSVEMCIQGLEEQNVDKIVSGIVLGNDIFKAWGLYNDELHSLFALLRDKGALTAKPIGAGLGGHMISLWKSKPKSDCCDICLTS